MHRVGSSKNKTKNYSTRDVIFTKQSVAEEMVNTVFEHFGGAPYWGNLTCIEPSAGAGVFLPSLKQRFRNVRAFDIEPQHAEVEKRDFLKFRTEERCVFWGNPPFSRTKEFLRHCATMGDHIVMILPMRYYNNVPFNTLDAEWRVEYSQLLADQPFETRKKINACILYLHRVPGYVRPKPEKLTPVGFTIKTLRGKKGGETFDFMFRQAGPRAGEAVSVAELKSGMGYGVLFQDRDKLLRIQQQLASPLCIPSRAATNDAFACIGKNDICKLFNPV